MGALRSEGRCPGRAARTRKARHPVSSRGRQTERGPAPLRNRQRGVEARGADWAAWTGSQRRARAAVRAQGRDRPPPLFLLLAGGGAATADRGRWGAVFGRGAAVSAAPALQRPRRLLIEAGAVYLWGGEGEG